jgi:hypothetical protein
MAYTPELDLESVRTLRRIAWAMKEPMTVALPSIVGLVAARLDARMVCGSCKDPRECEQCPFKKGKPRTPGSG